MNVIRRRIFGALCAAAAIWTAIAAAPCAAHELRPAYLEISEHGGDYRITFKVPARGALRLGLYVRLPDGCTDRKPPHTEKTYNAFVDHRTVSCRGGLAGKAVGIDGLAGTLTDVVARVALVDGGVQTVRLTPDRPVFEVTGTPTHAETAQTYFLLGVEHILLGLDHLLFVLALLLLTGKSWTLVKTITAFTLAHSVTLAAGSLGWAHAPQAPVEALIALSIVYAAAAIPRARQGARDLVCRAPWLTAFAFGLLHGFGFGGALKEIGLPQADVPLALLTFNLGVEAGQLLFVGAVLALGFVLRPVPFPDWAGGRTAAAYGIGGLAAFWFLERMAAVL